MSLDAIMDVKWYKPTGTEEYYCGLRYTPIYKSYLPCSRKFSNEQDYLGVLRMHSYTTLPSAKELAVFFSNATFDQAEHDFDEWTRTFCIYFKEGANWHASFNDSLYSKLKSRVQTGSPLHRGPVFYHSQKGFFMKRPLVRKSQGLVSRLIKNSKQSNEMLLIQDSDTDFYETGDLDALLGKVSLKLQTRNSLEKVTPRLRLYSAQYLDSLNLPQNACPITAVRLCRSNSYSAYKETFCAASKLNCSNYWRYVQNSKQSWITSDPLLADARST